ncbi:hypothetical protein DERF_011578 [Dermatophagoides farinae]|uniref:Uncharacterized protein n=1 Tax=Dermatophagoides farinae TaxID=6954 RepID=A0A922HTC6_DERFA|nr:hypothetical protein DERF_011578 [Dermatophagoides farinae]
MFYELPIDLRIEYLTNIYRINHSLPVTWLNDCRFQLDIIIIIFLLMVPKCLRCGRFSQFASILGCESEIFFRDRKLQ